MEEIESENEYLEKERRGIQGEPEPKINLDLLMTMGKEKGFEIEKNIDYGYGQIDLVWYINLHPLLQSIRCGFIALGSEEELYDINNGGGSKDSEDNQYSIRKIEEAAMRGIRSGMDKVFLVVQNEEMAKSVSGKIEWLASFGSLLRLDVISLGIYSEQKEPVLITPSQQRVPDGEKIGNDKTEENKKDIVKETLKPITKVKSKEDKELQEQEVESTGGGLGAGGG